MRPRGNSGVEDVARPAPSAFGGFPMRSAYKYLAHTIAAFVAIQAAVMVFAVAGLGLWIDDGHSVSESNFNENEIPDFTGSIGLTLHGIFGTMVIPLLAIILLVLSFFAKIPG